MDRGIGMIIIFKQKYFQMCFWSFLFILDQLFFTGIVAVSMCILLASSLAVLAAPCIESSMKWTMRHTQRIVYLFGHTVVKLSLSLYSLSLRESWHYNHSVPHHPPTANFLRTLELTYTQVWYIIGIVSSSPTQFHSEKIGLFWVTYDPLSVIGLINI